jgi:ferric iron reductase protein FhuF
VDALEATGEINAKLIWSNTGYLIHWYLTEMKPLLGDENVDALRQSCFFAKQLSDGRDNPLFRTVVLRDGFWFAAPAASAIACRTLSSAGIAR